MNVSILEKSKVKKEKKWVDVRSVIFGWRLREDENNSESEIEI